MWKLGTSLLVVLIAGAILWRTNLLRAGESAKHTSLDLAEVKLAIAALDAEADNSDPQPIRDAIKRAVSVLGSNHYASEMLTAGSRNAMTVSDLQDLVARVQESLTFRPWMEAKLPVGFPQFTPVHRIEVKTLPGYRMARVSMTKKSGAKESGTFWSLFSHIKRNDIAMTAPVQVDYSDDSADAKEASMAFLYGSQELGPVGVDSKDARVEVTDIKPHQVVSIGVRGRMSEKSVAAAHAALLFWLERNKNKFVADGSLRKMGYNSPFMPDSRKYFEVQIPVATVTDVMSN